MTTTNNTQKYRMVALDLDGTLLQPNHHLSDETISYLRSLHRRGFIISIATGRVASSTFEHIARLALSGGMHVVCSNGAHGVRVEVMINTEDDDDHDENKQEEDGIRHLTYHSPYTQQTSKLRIHNMFYRPVSQEITLQVVHFAKTLGCVVQYYVGDDVYANAITQNDFQLTKRYADLTGMKHLYCNDDFKTAMKRGLPSKLLVLCNEPHVDDVTHKLKHELGGRATVIRGSPSFFVEVLDHGVCKGSGLKQISDVLDVALDDIVAFGDGDNDVEFLDLAGWGVAMNNARDTAKAVANELCQWTNAEDGVVKKLKQLEQKGCLHFTPHHVERKG